MNHELSCDCICITDTDYIADEHPTGFDRERDLVGTQLVRRNDEMACLNEKLKLQNTRMGCGEVHYNARVNDIQVLAREVGGTIGDELKTLCEMRYFKGRATPSSEVQIPQAAT